MTDKFLPAPDAKAQTPPHLPGRSWSKVRDAASHKFATRLHSPVLGHALLAAEGIWLVFPTPIVSRCALTLES